MLPHRQPGPRRPPRRGRCRPLDRLPALLRPHDRTQHRCPPRAGAETGPAWVVAPTCRRRVIGPASATTLGTPQSTGPASATTLGTPRSTGPASATTLGTPRSTALLSATTLGTPRSTALLSATTQGTPRTTSTSGSTGPAAP